MAEVRRSSDWSLRRSLRAKVTVGVIVPLVLILGAFTAIEYLRHREAFLTNLSSLASQSGKVIENNLRHAMLESDFSEVQILLDSLGEIGEFRILYLLDSTGKVIFAPQGEGVGARLDNQGPDCSPCHRLPPEERPDSVVVAVDNNQRVFRSMQPVENGPECAQCHDPAERLIGLLLTDIPMGPMEASIAADLREKLLWWAGTIIVTVLIVNLALSRMVLRQINQLFQALNSFSEGRLAFHIPMGDPDEIGQLGAAFNEMTQRIEAETASNQALSEHLKQQSAMRGELLRRLISAQENERKRISRELHDELGQALSGLALHAEIIERYIPEDIERALDQLQETRALINDTSDQMYDLILDLRPAALDDLGLVVALRSHFERFLDGTGIEYEFQVSNINSRMPHEVETCLYRTFQEALTNIVRHAEAQNVHVSLTRHNGYFEGEIVDDGVGFDPEIAQKTQNGPGGLGIIGMQERVTQCGGQFNLISRPGMGTTIKILIPLEEPQFG